MGKFPLFLLLSLFTGCLWPEDDGKQDPLKNSRYQSWDTVLTNDAKNVLDPVIVSRSVLSGGGDALLSGFLNKCLRDKEVRIGFIGGSVTEGALAAEINKRYSTLFTEFMHKALPETDIVEINAGIGATNSRFGASRIAVDILSKNPDLIVIDFAVNDNPFDSNLTLSSMEGIIRQCLKQNVPAILISFMNSSGNEQNQRLHARVGRHYITPHISYRNALWPEIEAGRMNWSDFAADEVHPSDTGHFAAAYFLFDFFKRKLESGIKKYPEFSLRPPLTSDIYEWASIYKEGDKDIQVLSLGGWSQGLRELGRIGFESDSAGVEMILEIEARELTVLYPISKTRNATVEVSLDGIPMDTLNNYFAEDWGGGMLKPYQVYSGAAIDKRRLSFRHLQGRDFQIQYLLPASGPSGY